MRRKGRKRHIALAALATTSFAAAHGCGGALGNADEGAEPRRTDAPRVTNVEADLEAVRRYDRGLERTIEYARVNPDIIPNKKGNADLSEHEKQDLREVYGATLDRIRALDQVKARWRAPHKISPLTRSGDHAKAYLVGYAAWMVQYRRGLDWIEMTVPNRAVETVLDEPAPRYDIPERSFADLKLRIIRVKEVSRLEAGYRYYETLRDDLEEAGCLEEPQCAATMQLVERHYADAREQLRKRGLLEFAYNAFDIARDKSLEAWFPVQSGVARWMGDTRYRRKGDHLVSHAQLSGMQAELEPGDIVVSRSNWYLSNAGLPGFWPHSAMYVGTPDEFAAYFDTPEIRAHFREETGHAGLVEYLRAEHPDVWANYTAPDSDGRPRSVLEARSEGVILNSFREGVAVDYAGAMRPTTSRLDKAKAIAKGFGMYGRPYDFNFDFLTDQSVVCTELIYKSWDRANTQRTPGYEPTLVMGRTTLPANELVRQFDTQRASGAANLEFVYFLDGREATGDAVVRGEEAFRASWKRSKWDFAQQ
jgi:hypothetical protein